MDDRERAYFLGAINAQRLLIERLYRVDALRHPLEHGWMTDIGKPMMAMVDEQPPFAPGTLSPEEQHTISQHTLHHLERFWMEMARGEADTSPRADELP